MWKRSKIQDKKKKICKIKMLNVSLKSVNNANESKL